MRKILLVLLLSARTLLGQVYPVSTNAAAVQTLFGAYTFNNGAGLSLVNPGGPYIVTFYDGASSAYLQWNGTHFYASGTVGNPFYSQYGFGSLAIPAFTGDASGLSGTAPISITGNATHDGSGNTIVGYYQPISGLGSAAFQATSAFDASGAAQAATNGFPWMTYSLIEAGLTFVPLTNNAPALVTGVTNTTLTASRVILTDANKAEVSATASGAVPINADGTATTGSQVTNLLTGTSALNAAQLTGAITSATYGSNFWPSVYTMTLVTNGVTVTPTNLVLDLSKGVWQKVTLNNTNAYLSAVINGAPGVPWRVFVRQGTNGAIASASSFSAYTNTILPQYFGYLQTVPTNTSMSTLVVDGYCDQDNSSTNHFFTRAVP